MREEKSFIFEKVLKFLEILGNQEKSKFRLHSTLSIPWWSICLQLQKILLQNEVEVFFGEKFKFLEIPGNQENQNSVSKAPFRYLRGLNICIYESFCCKIREEKSFF